MASLCPTVTASEPHEYREQMEAIASFAKRVHIDISDGHFAPKRLVAIEQCWWPEHLAADFHVMYLNPLDYVERIIELGPDLIVVHAEANRVYEAIAKIKQAGIRAGLALLQTTAVSSLELSGVDHVLIFSGKLGYHGGTADLKLLDKVSELKTRNAELEIGWDGGVNDANAPMLIRGGIDVLNVGGYIQNAEVPADAYAKLIAAIEKDKA